MTQHRKEGGRAGKCLKSLWAELQGPDVDGEEKRRRQGSLPQQRQDASTKRERVVDGNRKGKRIRRGIGGSCCCVRMTRRQACMCGHFGAYAGILFQTRGPWCMGPSAKNFSSSRRQQISHGSSGARRGHGSDELEKVLARSLTDLALFLSA